MPATFNALSPLWGRASFITRDKGGAWRFVNRHVQSYMNEAFVEVFENFHNFISTLKRRKDMGNVIGNISFRFITSGAIADLTDESPIKVIWFERSKCSRSDGNHKKQVVAFPLKTMHEGHVPHAIFAGNFAYSYSDLLHL